MKRLFPLLAGLLLCLWTMPALAEPEPAREEHAAHGAESHEEATPWYNNQDLWKIINIALVVYIAMRMSDGAITRAMRARSSKIRQELQEAREALEASEKRYDDAEFRLAKLHEELESMREEGSRLAQAEKERTLREAQVAAEEIAERSRVQLTQETLKAQRELRQFVAKLVVEKLGEELKRKVELQGDQPFVHSILAKVEALN